MVGVTLLADAELASLNVLAGDDGRLIVRGPRSADALARRLLAHKADVLAALTTVRQPAVRRMPAVVDANGACPCGSTKFTDVPIHDGKSVRRDCAQCSKFLSFAVWYGKQKDNTCNSEQ
jgi:hypothetical protein